tara:strand:+ start:210 stop:662 length:453 start_codon:yes stop_codon:yes gene_type:complete
MKVICAIDENYGFGKNETLPWKCTRDLKHFKKTTLNSTLIMGRKTWDSLPLLQNRRCIVISSLDNLGTTTVRSLDEAYENYYDAFLIGGIMLIEEAITKHMVEYVHLTIIKGVHDSTLYFRNLPYLLEKNFTLLFVEEHEECTFYLYCHI